MGGPTWSSSVTRTPRPMSPSATRAFASPTPRPRSRCAGPRCGSPLSRGGEQVAEEILRRRVKIDGLVCANDELAWAP